MTEDLVLNSSCGGCGSTTELYGSNCKHLTLCLACGKTMVKKRSKCYECGVTITKLIREYIVRSSIGSDKSFSIGRFPTGLPPFSKKRNAENKWTLQKDGLQGRQITDALREKYKNKPWILEDETGQHQFQGHIEGAQSAAYYLLMMQGKEFVAIPAGSWYNFNKTAQYKQLTLEEAEEKMNKRKNNATGYERWMMKAATNGPAAFGETKNLEGPTSANADSIRSGKLKNEDDDHLSDHAEEDEEEEAARRNRLGLNKKGSDDDEEGARDRDFDLDDDIEKGDDWEHEEIFTDDDEAVGNDPMERDDLAPEIPAPPEIKQDEADDSEEDGGLSKSGKELQKLLGRTNGLNESDAEDGEDDDDVEDETDMSPVLAPKKMDPPKQEPADITPSKPTPSASGKVPTAKSAKSKRKHVSEDANKNAAATKKIKTDSESKQSTKDHSIKSTASIKSSSTVLTKPASTSSSGPVTEKEIRNVLLTMGPMKTQDLVAKFKPRLQEKKDKNAFADILKRISKIQKINGSSYVVLKDR